MTICAVVTAAVVAAAGSGSGEGNSYLRTQKTDPMAQYRADHPSNADNSNTSNPNPAAICDSFELEYLSSALWSVINEVSVAGDFAYCATANGLMVIDVSHPEYIRTVATHSERVRCISVTLDGSTLYVGTMDSGLLIFDVSKPAIPQLSCHVKSPEKVWDIVVNHCIIYQLGDDSLQIYRLADTGRPVLLGSTGYALWEGGPKRSLVLDGNTIYVAAGRLSSIDVSVNSRPAVLDTINSRHMAVDVGVVGGLAVVADKSNWTPGYRSSVTLFDISAPDSLSIVGFFEYWGSIWDVEVDGGYVFAAAGGDGIAVLDISEPSAPVPLVCYPTAGSARDISVSSNAVYVANINPPLPDAVSHTQTLCNQNTYPDTVAQSLPENVTPGDFLIIDIEDFDNVYLAGQLHNPGYTQSLTIGGDIVFSADEHGSVAAAKIRRDYTLEPIGYLRIDPAPQSLTVRGDLLLVSNAYGGLSVIDVSDPSRMAEVGVYNSTGWISDAKIVDDTAFVCEGAAGLAILDISSPESPQVVSSTNTADAATAIVVDSMYCFVACRYGGLEVYDVSNARSPVRVGKYPPEGQEAWNIYLAKEKHILVTGASFYLYVLDVSDPNNPILLSEIYTPEVFDIALKDGLLYVVRGRDGVDVIDLSDPSSPCKIGGTRTVNFALGVALSGPKVLVADFYNLLEFRLLTPTDVTSGQRDQGLLPSEMILHQNYPNPFNSSTVIEFQVPRADLVTLEIFNIAGQRVRSLIDHAKLAGMESVEWDGTDITGESVASGLYLYRLSTDQNSRSKKMVFLK